MQAIKTRSAAPLCVSDAGRRPAPFTVLGRSPRGAWAGARRCWIAPEPPRSRAWLNDLRDPGPPNRRPRLAHHATEGLHRSSASSGPMRSSQGDRPRRAAGPSHSTTAATRRLAGLAAGAAAGLVWSTAGALAHVKWFEPYDVSTAQVPVRDTLSLPAFWAAVALVLAAFLAAAALEDRAVGRALTAALDRRTAPLRMQADRFMLCVVGAFFVALFAVGTTILTPDLLTGAPWVAWVQLGIALCLFSHRLYKVAAIGIVGLWCFALADYDLFHMLDYVALGIGLAGYLWLASLRTERWRSKRFDTLRWAVAIALMWSSMEKFGYPAWFTPLLEKKPYLALGLPFPTFTTMCGVAEFALAFGLLWSPLVRRLSALGLFALMAAAVFPFGRTDLIGHATILAALLLVAANAGGGERYTAPRLGRALLRVPAGLAVALAASLLSYSSIHHVIYRDGHPAWLATAASTDTIQPGGTLPPHSHLFGNEDDDDTRGGAAAMGPPPVRGGQ